MEVAAVPSLPSFRGWVHQQVAKRTKSYDAATVDATIKQIRDHAEMRGKRALLEAMGAENTYQFNADMYHAVNVVVQTVVAGVFGEIPLTAEEKAAKFDAFKTILKQPIDSAWASAKIKQAAPVTQEILIEAAEKLKKSGVQAHFMLTPDGDIYQQVKAMQPKSPAQLGQIGDWPPNPVYGPVTMGSNQKAPKSGLPAAGEAKKVEEEALNELWSAVAEQSDKLLGIKQTEKYNELVGIDPEEI